MKQIDYDSAQREEETFPFLRKCEQNCNHGAKVQKHIENTVCVSSIFIK